MKTANDIANDLAPHIAANNGAIGHTNFRRVKLGWNGLVRANVLLTPRDVNYTSALDSNDHGVAVLSPQCPITLDSVDGMYGTEVWLANEPGSSEPTIVGLADKALRSQAGTTPAEKQSRDAAFPDQSRLRILRLMPESGSLSVKVDCGPNALAYKRADGSRGFVSTETVDLSDPTDSAVWVPVSAAISSGKHRLVFVGFNPETDSWAAVAGDEVTPSDTLPQRNDFAQADYEAIDTAGYIAAGFVYMYDGQTAPFVEDDMLRVFDPRLLIAQETLSPSVSTTDATATIIASIPVAELSALVITGEGVSVRDDYSAACGVTFNLTVRRASGGNVTLVTGSDHITVDEDSGASPTWTAPVNTSTQTVDITVTNVAAQNWSSRVTYRITKV